MFEEFIGKRVKICILEPHSKSEGDTQWEYNRTLIAVEDKLLKTDGDEVFNAGSPCFIMLELSK